MQDGEESPGQTYNGTMIPVAEETATLTVSTTSRVHSVLKTFIVTLMLRMFLTRIVALDCRLIYSHSYGPHQTHNAAGMQQESSQPRVGDVTGEHSHIDGLPAGPRPSISRRSQVASRSTLQMMLLTMRYLRAISHQREAK